MQPVDLNTLKSKYGIWEFRDFPPSSDLYAILQKLDSRQRLEPSEVVWLRDNGLFRRESKIAQAYHRLEALFYEQEFQRTHSLWHLPSASSHWRHAGKPKRALKLTDSLNWEQVKDKKLKSALLTTRGGAFRDLKELEEAEKCARFAIQYQPKSHHPYTLMGAICYERGEYYEGDRWFAEAIKRGASPRDEDAEIKRVVREAKDQSKRRQVVEYLLQKDPNRYAWAKSSKEIPEKEAMNCHHRELFTHCHSIISRSKPNMNINRKLQILVSQIWDKKQREEFLRVASNMKPADELLLLMKQQIDKLGSENKTLQQLLDWVNQKSLSINGQYKPAAVRAFYLALIRVIGLAFVKTLDPNVKLNGAEARRFAQHFERAHSLADRPDTITLNLSLGFGPVGVIARVFAFDFSPELKLTLQELQAIIPSPKNDIKGFQQWRKDNGAAWIEKLGAALGYDLHFSEEEKEMVKQYYDAHNLLVECLNSDRCEVTIAVRQQIEETLLLPYPD